MFEQLSEHQYNNKIKNKLLEILNEDKENEEYIISQFKPETSEDYLCELFKILTHLDLDKDEAKNHWQEIIKHQAEMKKILGRDIGLRVALFDYFVNINKQLSNPKIMEIHLYELTAKLALLDELTWLYNRRYFNNAIEKEFKRAMRHEEPLSLILFDIDDFKKVNDTYGHQFGDTVLSKVAQVIIKNSRTEDVACRYGGEEFAIILPITNKEGAVRFAIRIKEEISELTFKHDVNITISGGVSSVPDDTKKISDLIFYADKAMYKSKFSGKNKVLPYN